jgi:hypothetical protein
MGSLDKSLAQTYKSCHLPMVRKSNRLIVLITACSAAGAIIGGTSNWIDSHTCLQAAQVTTKCLTQDPLVSTIQGMSIGLVAGAGAAVGASRQVKQRD